MSQPLPNRFDLEIAEQGSKISSALHMLRSQQYPPDARKGLRKFQIGEVADFMISSAGGYLRDLTKRSERGEFSLGPMVMALLKANGAGGKLAG